MVYTRVHTMDARTYGVGIDCVNVNIDVLVEKNSLGPNIMKFAKDGEYNKDALFHAGKSILQIMGWNDPDDVLLVHAYIAKIQHRATIKRSARKIMGVKVHQKRYGDWKKNDNK